MKKIGLVITCFNRPEYLKRCFESLINSDTKDIKLIVLVDDCSTNLEAIQLFNQFNLDGVMIVKFRNPVNCSVRAGLIRGYETCYAEGCEIVMNIDSDAIVKPDFITRITSLNKAHKDSIVSGFNCLTKNRDGSERHLILKSFENYHLKKSIGGINMCMYEHVYWKYVRPSLTHPHYNWDNIACLNAMKYGKPIVVLFPSVIQHIGMSSSMGHHDNPDTAEDF